MKGFTALAALMTFGVLAGCATSRMHPQGRSPVPGEELRAMLLPQLGGPGDALRFQLNRPAYVAVFRIVPGYGTTLLYPRPGYGSPDGFIYSGVHRVADDPWGSQSYRTGRVAGGPRSGGEPEFYLVIASELPLDFDRLWPHGGQVSPLTFRYASFSAFETMEALVSSVVPEPGSSLWTTDFYVHWPEYLSARPGAGLVEVSCTGYRVWVSPANVEEAARRLCEAGGRSRRPAFPSPERSSDSTEVVEPARRPPVPRAARVASSQLESPEVWEAARRAAIEGRRSNVDDDDGSAAEPGVVRRSRPVDAGYAPPAPVGAEPEGGPPRRRPTLPGAPPGWNDPPQAADPFRVPEETAPRGRPEPLPPTEPLYVPADAPPRSRPDPAPAPVAPPAPPSAPGTPPPPAQRLPQAAEPTRSTGDLPPRTRPTLEAVE